MPKTQVIQVFEHESIAFKGRYKKVGFTESLYEAFESYFQSDDKTPYFQLIPHGVKFTQYVGAIKIGGVTIEVLPKAGKQGDAEQWQGVLLDMLSQCNLMTAKKTGKAALRLKSNSILDLYFELFISEVEGLVRRGLIKKYRKVEGQKNALKGALVFSKHLQKNIVHKEKFYTRHTHYDQNHLLHSILYKTLEVIGYLTSAPKLKDRLGRLYLSFPEVDNVKINSSHFQKMVLDRKSQPYEEALAISKLILLNYRPDLMAGKTQLLALMFDMNVLWEEYVLQVLKRKLQGYEVRGQKSMKFWKHKSIRPDIVLTHKETQQIVIVDTKWKVIEASKPSDADLKQMYVYNHHWEANQSILLYPRAHANQEDNHGEFALDHKGATHSCRIGFVDVLDERYKLSKDLAEQVNQKIN